ncbi:hypothetical protein ZIOFF_073672 [Zingiber officinale]|uniref:Polygalacturonase n=1 Tax=Zingiber officinale TaxID=94328 RepID=A0A8J5C9M2_ZINOF|nr:hypothetical protein ZIOFF_073672 [Zingiber officinale]
MALPNDVVGDTSLLLRIRIQREPPNDSSLKVLWARPSSQRRLQGINAEKNRFSLSNSSSNASCFHLSAHDNQFPNGPAKLIFPLYSDHHLVPKPVLRQSGSSIFSVDEFGAKGHGSFDNRAFEKAWKRACSSNGAAVVLVPKHKTYRLKPIKFQGPCKGRVTVQALFFKSCKNLVVENLNVKDSQQIQVNIMRCRNVKVSNLNVSAPDLSPNTDGIHVTNSRNVLIKDSIIGTGDDCISIVSGCRRITARNIVCGPGHGISIGSLGFNQTRANVSNVLVDGAILKGTTNGVRIKTWQGGRGYARRIVFQNIEMQNVKNPIIIDQNYCDSEIPCSQQKNAVAVRNVVYRNIKGTSRSEDAMTLNCSSSVPCQGVLLSNIDLVGAEGVEGNVTAVCENLRWLQIGKVVPRLICA